MRKLVGLTCQSHPKLDCENPTSALSIFLLFVYRGAERAIWLKYQIGQTLSWTTLKEVQMRKGIRLIFCQRMLLHHETPPICYSACNIQFF